MILHVMKNPRKPRILLWILVVLAGWALFFHAKHRVGGHGKMLSTQDWKSSSSTGDTREPSQRAYDGDPITRWNNCRHQHPEDWFRVDLGRARRIVAIHLDSRRWPNDYPRACVLSLSSDDENYDVASMEMSDDKGYTQITLSRPRLARYIHLALAQTDAPSSWSIGEIHVLALPTGLSYVIRRLLPLGGFLLSLLTLSLLVFLAISNWDGIGSLYRGIQRFSHSFDDDPLRIHPVSFKFMILFHLLLLPLFLWTLFNNGLPVRLIRHENMLTFWIDGEEIHRQETEDSTAATVRFRMPFLPPCPQILTGIRVADPNTNETLFPRDDVPSWSETGDQLSRSPWFHPDLPHRLLAPWTKSVTNVEWIQKRNWLTGKKEGRDYVTLPLMDLQDFDLTFSLWNPLGLGLDVVPITHGRAKGQWLNLDMHLFSPRGLVSVLFKNERPPTTIPYRPGNRRYAALILFRITLAMVVAEMFVVAILVASCGLKWVCTHVSGLLSRFGVKILIFLGMGLVGAASLFRPVIVTHGLGLLVFSVILLVFPYVSRRAPAKIVAPFLFIAAFATILYVNYWVFGHFPSFGDEMNYLFQARILASGKLFVPEPERFGEFFKVPWQDLFGDDGKIWGFHCIGNSLLLALGFLVGAPWIIPPLVGAGTVLFLYLLSLEMYRDRRTSFLVGILCLASQYFLGLMGSFMAHGPTVFFLTVFFYCLVRNVRTSRTRFAVASGASLGMGMIMRPLSALLGSVSFAFYGALNLLASRWRFRCFAVFLIFLSLFGSLECVRVYLTCGRFTMGYYVKGPLTRPDGELFSAERFSINKVLHQAWGNVTHLSERLYGLPYYLNLCLFFLPFLLFTRNRWDYLLLLYFLIFWIGHSIMFWRGYKFEPRLIFESFPALVILSARGWHGLLTLDERFPKVIPFDCARWVRGLTWILIAWFLTFNYTVDLPYRFQCEYKDYCNTSPGIRDSVLKQDIHNAIVFIANLNFQFAPMVVYNALDFEGDVIYALDLGKEKNRELIEAYPDRRVFYVSGMGGVLVEGPR